MVAEIVCVGTELLLGDIVNTNAQHISKELAHIGIDLYYQTVVGDNPERVWNVLDTALKRSDLIIMTGGLGPTKDDLTKEVAASFFGKKLVFHEKTYEHVRKKLESYGINEMTESQKKQALVPEGSLVVTNPAGLAPGIIMAQGDKAIVMLPGPPKEMKAVLAECCHFFPLSILISFNYFYTSSFTHAIFPASISAIFVTTGCIAVRASSLVFPEAVTRINTPSSFAYVATVGFSLSRMSPNRSATGASPISFNGSSSGPLHLILIDTNT